MDSMFCISVLYIWQQKLWKINEWNIPLHFYHRKYYFFTWWPLTISYCAATVLPSSHRGCSVGFACSVRMAPEVEYIKDCIYVEKTFSDIKTHQKPNSVPSPSLSAAHGIRADGDAKEADVGAAGDGSRGNCTGPAGPGGPGQPTGFKRMLLLLVLLL